MGLCVGGLGGDGTERNTAGDPEATDDSHVPFVDPSQGGNAATTEWSAYTWQQYYDLCRDFARSLIKLDFKVRPWSAFGMRHGGGGGVSRVSPCVANRV